jgi:N-acetylmuramoyl-L-alanine amidase
MKKFLKRDPNIVVVYTRKSDVFSKLKDRPKKANGDALCFHTQFS